MVEYSSSAEEIIDRRLRNNVSRGGGSGIRALSTFRPVWETPL